MDDDATLERDRDQSVLERAKDAAAEAVRHGEDDGTARNSSQGLDDEALADGPANTDPNLAQGSM